MEDAAALKALFDSFGRLSKSGKGMLVAYGQGLQTMEEMISTEHKAHEKKNERKGAHHDADDLI